MQILYSLFQGFMYDPTKVPSRSHPKIVVLCAVLVRLAWYTCGILYQAVPIFAWYNFCAKKGPDVACLKLVFLSFSRICDTNSKPDVLQTRHVGACRHSRRLKSRIKTVVQGICPYDLLCTPYLSAKGNIVY